MARLPDPFTPTPLEEDDVDPSVSKQGDAVDKLLLSEADPDVEELSPIRNCRSQSKSQPLAIVADIDEDGLTQRAPESPTSSNTPPPNPQSMPRSSRRKQPRREAKSTRSGCSNEKKQRHAKERHSRSPSPATLLAAHQARIESDVGLPVHRSPVTPRLRPARAALKRSTGQESESSLSEYSSGNEGEEEYVNPTQRAEAELFDLLELGGTPALAFVARDDRKRATTPAVPPAKAPRRKLGGLGLVPPYDLDELQRSIASDVTSIRQLAPPGKRGHDSLTEHLVALANKLSLLRKSLLVPHP